MVCGSRDCARRSRTGGASGYDSHFGSQKAYPGCLSSPDTPSERQSGYLPVPVKLLLAALAAAVSGPGWVANTMER